MPVPEERLYRPDRLNVWFAVSAVLMAASILWMIWVDYRRPWQDFQRDFYLSKAAFAHLDYLNAVREDRVAERAAAGAQVEQRKEYLTLTEGDRLNNLRAELAEATLNFRLANGPWSAASQLLDVTRDAYERALGAHGSEHPQTRAAHEQLLREQDTVEKLRKDKEQFEDQRRFVEGQIKRIEAPVRDAEKKRRELEQVVDAARQKDQQYRGVLTDAGLLGGLPIVSALMNAPLLDFLAPKNTPGRYQVNQLVLPQVRQQLNYLETYTTDRCITCHVGIADPEFSMDRLARKFESALPAINEALQRMGQTPLDPPDTSMLTTANATTLKPGQITEHWDILSRQEKKAYFNGLVGRVNQYLELSSRKKIELGQPLLAHPDLDLYVNVDSPHPMARMGCTVCHAGNPQETDFVLSGHTPATHVIEEEWAGKYYVRSAGIPKITFEWMAHFWDRPMLLPQYTEAGCAKCHYEITDISRFEGRSVGTTINLGRHLFANTGCVNCHAVSDIPDARRVGPDLSHVASKLQPGFVQQWAFFPQKFRPSTLMPHFFLQENNIPESRNQFDPQPLLRSETEVAAISRFLFAVSKEWKPLPKPDDVQGDAERGRQLFKQVGCLGCHTNLAENGEQWIISDLLHRAKLDGEKLDPETAAFRYKGMTYEQRARYAMEHFAGETDSFLKPDTVRFDPEAGYTRPIFSRVGPELSGIGSKVTFDWLFSWVSDPAHYSKMTKMPNLRLSPGEAADIAAYLLTLKHDKFEPTPFEMDAPRQAMADELIFTLLAAQRSERRSRAVLQDEGGELTEMLVSMVAPAFAKEGVADPVGDQQRAYDLVRAMSLQDKKMTFLGNKMISHYGCYACHLIPGFKDTTPPGTNLTTWAQKPITQLDFAFYDDAFHDMREEKEDIFGHLYPQTADALNYWSPGENPLEQITHTHAAFAKHKLLNPRIWDREKIKRPYDKLKMPNFYFSNEEAAALTTYLLSRVEPRVDEDLKIDYHTTLAGPIARGRQLVRELNCVSCHQIENNVPVVQQYFRRELAGKWRFDETNAPPLLWGEGAKVQHHWLHRFLQHVETLRPWLQIHMPTFYWDGVQTTGLVEFFAALSQSDSRWLKKTLVAVNEFREAAPKRTGETVPDRASTKEDEAGDSGANWFRQDTLQSMAANLRAWAVDRRLMRPADVDMLRLSPQQAVDAHAKLLERAAFMAKVNDVAYPFVEPVRPVSAPPRFELGRSFFNDMGCLKCHVFGNMQPGPASNTDEFVQTYRLDAVRGEGDSAVAIINGVAYSKNAVIDGHTLDSAININYDSGDIETKAYFNGPMIDGETERIMLQAASAPNLALTHQRLRRGWVHEWMLNPHWIQPGTKMPQNFPGGESPFQGDPRYPGSGEDHINLLMDYLYDAGITGTRSPQPKLLAPAKSEEFDENAGAAEEFKD